MADEFLNDYSNLAFAGSAFEGFAKGFENAQDRSMKRMEHEAQMAAVAEKAQRERDQLEITKYKDGIVKGPDGQLGPRPLSQEEIAAKQGKELNPEQNITFDARGNPIKKTYSDEYKQMKKDALLADPYGLKGLGAAKAREDLIKARSETAEKARKLTTSPIPGWRKTQDYSADSTEERQLKDGYTEAKKFTTLMGNLKAKVEGANKLDLGNPASDTAKAIKQDLRNLQLLYKSPSFAQLGVLAGPDLMLLEDVLENPGSISNLFSGKAGVLDRYNQLQQTIDTNLNEKIKAHGLEPDPGYAAPPAPKPQGMLKKKGLLKQAGGLIMPGAQAGGAKGAPKANTVIQNGITYTLNPATGEYE